MKKLVMLVLFCTLGLATIGCDSGKKPDDKKGATPAPAAGGDKGGDKTPAPPATPKKN